MQQVATLKPQQISGNIRHAQMVGKLLGRLNSFLRIFFHISYIYHAKLTIFLQSTKPWNHYFDIFAYFETIFADFASWAVE